MRAVYKDERGQHVSQEFSFPATAAAVPESLPRPLHDWENHIDDDDSRRVASTLPRVLLLQQQMVEEAMQPSLTGRAKARQEIFQRRAFLAAEMQRLGLRPMVNGLKQGKVLQNADGGQAAPQLPSGSAAAPRAPETPSTATAAAAAAAARTASAVGGRPASVKPSRAASRVKSVPADRQGKNQRNPILVHSRLSKRQLARVAAGRESNLLDTEDLKYVIPDPPVATASRLSVVDGAQALTLESLPATKPYYPRRRVGGPLDNEAPGGTLPASLMAAGSGFPGARDWLGRGRVGGLRSSTAAAPILREGGGAGAGGREGRGEGPVMSAHRVRLMKLARVLQAAHEQGVADIGVDVLRKAPDQKDARRRPGQAEAVTLTPAPASQSSPASAGTALPSSTAAAPSAANTAKAGPSSPATPATQGGAATREAGAAGSEHPGPSRTLLVEGLVVSDDSDDGAPGAATTSSSKPPAAPMSASTSPAPTVAAAAATEGMPASATRAASPSGAASSPSVPAAPSPSKPSLPTAAAAAAAAPSRSPPDNQVRLRRGGEFAVVEYGNRRPHAKPPTPPAGAAPVLDPHQMLQQQHQQLLNLQAYRSASAGNEIESGRARPSAASPAEAPAAAAPPASMRAPTASAEGASAAAAAPPSPPPGAPPSPSPLAASSPAPAHVPVPAPAPPPDPTPAAPVPPPSTSTSPPPPASSSPVATFSPPTTASPPAAAASPPAASSPPPTASSPPPPPASPSAVASSPPPTASPPPPNTASPASAVAASSPPNAPSGPNPASPPPTPSYPPFSLFRDASEVFDDWVQHRPRSARSSDSAESWGVQSEEADARGFPIVHGPAREWPAAETLGASPAVAGPSTGSSMTAAAAAAAGPFNSSPAASAAAAAAAAPGGVADALDEGLGYESSGSWGLHSDDEKRGAAVAGPPGPGLGLGAELSLAALPRGQPRGPGKAGGEVSKVDELMELWGVTLERYRPPRDSNIRDVRFSEVPAWVSEPLPWFESRMDDWWLVERRARNKASRAAARAAGKEARRAAREGGAPGCEDLETSGPEPSSPEQVSDAQDDLWRKWRAQQRELDGSGSDEEAAFDAKLSAAIKARHEEEWKAWKSERAMQGGPGGSYYEEVDIEGL